MNCSTCDHFLHDVERDYVYGKINCTKHEKETTEDEICEDWSSDFIKW